MAVSKMFFSLPVYWIRYCFVSEDKDQIVMRYVYSGTSGAASLQQFVESNVYHRQGKAKLPFSIFVFFFSRVVYTSDDGD